MLPGSVSPEGEVPVEAKNGLAPKEDERGLVQALDPVVDQGDSVPEGTKKVRGRN